jgi:hypothetical protein
MRLLDLANVLQACAALSAAILAWRRASYRPVACLLGLTTIADWLRLLLDKAILSTAPRPYEGMARVGFHLEQALFLTWPAALAAVAGWVFGRRRPWIVALVYSAAMVFLCAGYPRIRGDFLRYVYLALHVLAFGYALICIMRQIFRAAPKIEIEHAAVVYATIISLAALLGPYTGSDWIARWNFAQLANIVMYGVLTYRQGKLLWN